MAILRTHLTQFICTLSPTFLTKQFNATDCFVKLFSTSAISMSPDEIEPPIASLVRTETRSAHPVAGAVDRSRTRQHCKTPWLSLSTLTYRFAHDNGAKMRQWDVVKRETRDQNAGADAVVVLARLRLTDDEPRVLLVKQFRPPMDGVTLELPAGLVDRGETVVQAALRELREETGFVGLVSKVHPPTPLSPGMTNETVVLVEVDVQGSALEQRLDVSENIHVISVPLARLADALAFLVQSEGVFVMHALSTLSVGIHMALSLNCKP